MGKEEAFFRIGSEHDWRDQIGESLELFRAWGKVRDQTPLVFFDPGAKVNFISPDLASTLGVRSEEMGSLQRQAWPH